MVIKNSHVGLVREPWDHLISVEQTSELVSMIKQLLLFWEAEYGGDTEMSICKGTTIIKPATIFKGI
jgi:hypothetical protein